MSFSGLNTSGGPHPCIMFHHRLVSCIKKELVPNRMCVIEGMDYLECISKRKQYALNFKVSEELHRNRILELPTYDEVHDRFVSKYQTATEVFEAQTH